MSLRTCWIYQYFYILLSFFFWNLIRFACKKLLNCFIASQNNFHRTMDLRGYDELVQNFLSRYEFVEQRSCGSYRFFPSRTWHDGTQQRATCIQILFECIYRKIVRTIYNFACREIRLKISLTIQCYI